MQLFVATKAFVLNSKGEVLIVRESSQYKDGVQVGKWDVVGGRIENGEALLDGLQREVKEESGLSCKDGKLIAVNEKFSTNNDVERHIVRIYYECVADSDEVILSIDHDLYKWIKPADHVDHDLIPDVHDMFEVYLRKTA